MLPLFWAVPAAPFPHPPPNPPGPQKSCSLQPPAPEIPSSFSVPIQPSKLSGHTSLSSFFKTLFVLLQIPVFFLFFFFVRNSQVAACSSLFSNYSDLMIEHFTGPTWNTDVDTLALLHASPRLLPGYAASPTAWKFLVGWGLCLLCILQAVYRGRSGKDAMWGRQR